MRASLGAGKRLVGLFVRLRDPAVVETLAASPLDFVILDVEHGSLERTDISQIVFTGIARDLPVIVRLPDASPAGMQHAIAVGASGVIVPHIASAEEATRVAAFTRSSALERSFAGMGRGSDFRRRSWSDFRAELRESFVVIAQIDELAGLNAVEDIAGVADIDAVFMASLSLALALDASEPHQASVVEQALDRICLACRANGQRVGMHLQNPSAEPDWSRRGVNFFVAGSDLTLLLHGARQLTAAYGANDAQP